MEERRDKLGRRIPVYDRTAVGKRAAATRKENRGKDDHARAGARGGKQRARGYFGYLKDSGQEDQLKAISRSASEASKKARERRKQDSMDRGGSK